MKIKRIQIEQFYHLKNLDIDLTYPKGHSKEGQPLDKVCFIGQSGTGKTTLLEILAAVALCERGRKGFSQKYDNQDLMFTNEVNVEYEVDDESAVRELKTNSLRQEENSFSYILKNKDNILFTQGGGFYVPTAHFLSVQNSQKEKKKTSGLHKLLQESTQNQFYYSNNNKRKEIKKLSSIITSDNLAEIVEAYFIKLDFYQQSEILFRAQLTQKLEEDNSLDIPKELKKWKEANPNPTDDFANLINPIVRKFGLELSNKISNFPPRLSFKHQLSQQLIDYNQLSAGTRQIIKNILPVHFLTPQFENSTFLIDEPENGLYPDIQREIISHYVNASHNTQFFFATHSPIIASSFEPWEIVELKFNTAIGGEVYQDLYYKGERHVDNYIYDPRYLEYGTVLNEIFDVASINEEGNQKLEDFVKLKAELESYSKKELQNPNGNELLKSKIATYKELRRKIDPVKYGREYAQT